MSSPKLIKLSENDRKDLVERIRKSSLSAEDRDMLCAVLETLSTLSDAYINKTTSIKRLLKIIFGLRSEKSKDVLPKTDQEKASPKKDVSKKKKRKGHGKNPASAYTGAEKEFVPHPDLVPGNSCPGCLKGKVYRLEQPQVVVRIEGGAPLSAKVTEYDQLRCNLCGDIFTSKPSEMKESKTYNDEACAIIALLKYGHGFPFYRLEKLQQSVGVPLPSSTQWDLVKPLYHKALPVYDELLGIAAQGDILYNDDTKNRILDLMGKERPDGRKGIFTSGIISQIDGRSIALYFSGVNHAGENITSLLKKREADRSPPIHMCDALPQNYSKEFKTILCNCLIHGRRNFVELIASFPDECQYVFETLAKVYKHDAAAKERCLSAQERLQYHQTHSRPLMDALHTWFNDQLDHKKVEPNSGLGGAISYMLKHWPKLTRFLEVPGAPLDNNICERALKQVILNRKNAYFFKTQFGAKVGDLFTSIIQTCKLSKINPFKYLVALQTHADDVAKSPEKWLPWNYHRAAAATIS